jgi:hypothetical protein
MIRTVDKEKFRQATLNAINEHTRLWREAYYRKILRDNNLDTSDENIKFLFDYSDTDFVIYILKSINDKE